MIALVKGKPDAVILTGGMMNSKVLTDAICAHIEPMAEVKTISRRIRDGGSCRRRFARSSEK